MMPKNKKKNEKQIYHGSKIEILELREKGGVKGMTSRWPLGHKRAHVQQNVYGERGVRSNFRLHMRYTVYSILFGCGSSR